MSGKAGRVALAVGTGGFSEVYRGVKKMNETPDMSQPAASTETEAQKTERLTAYEEGKKRMATNSRRLLTGDTTAKAGTSLLK